MNVKMIILMKIFLGCPNPFRRFDLQAPLQQTMPYCNLEWISPKYNALRRTMSQILRRKQNFLTLRRVWQCKWVVFSTPIYHLENLQNI